MTDPIPTYDDGDSQRQADQRPAEQGLILGRYRYMSSCGTGGFGKVLVCWDTRLQRRVAIKRMPLVQPGYATSAQIIDEALTEARTSSMLANPNIVTMYDFEVDQSWAYLVMEFVDGLTLSEFLARVEGGTLTNDECAFLVLSVGSALAYAHENGVLHLDIKPTNIMFEHDGTIKLCDFGMATLASAAGYGGARGGTVGYMPPEQITGDMVDERCDVFSLAVVCWQALTGQNPFAAPTAEESLRLIERGPRREISRVDPDVTGMAAEAIMQAISPNPASRPPSVEAFAQEVAFALGDPDAGAASIKSLMLQSSEETAEEAEDYLRDQLPLSYRYPWLADVLARAASALTVGWATADTAAAWAGSYPHASLVVACVAAVATAAWPPLGSLLAMGSLAGALLRSTLGAQAILWSIILMTAFGVWWVRIGRLDRLSACSLVLPACVSNPFLAAPLAGFSQRPLAAAASAAFSAYLACVVEAVAPHGFGADAAVSSLTLGQLSPGPLAGYLLVGASAALCALVTRRWGSVRSSVAGQLTCGGLLLFGQLVLSHMKNGGIWPGATWIHAVLAVLLTVFLCFMAIIRGPLPTAEEV